MSFVNFVGRSPTSCSGASGRHDREEGAKVELVTNDLEGRLEQGVQPDNS